jgi:hypothetical protein
MKETMAEFQQKTNQALEAMVANHQALVVSLGQRDDNVKGALDRRDDRLDRHSKKIGEDSSRVIAAFFFDERRLLTISRLMSWKTRSRC